MKKYYFFIVSLLFLVSCSSIPLKSLYKVSKIDLRTINPKAVAVAIKMPKYLRARQLSLKLSHTPEGKIAKPLVFSLIKYDGSKEYKKHQESGYSISAYKLSERDVLRLVDFRKRKLTSQKTQKGQYNTKVSVSYKGLCRVEQSDEKSLLISIFIKTNNASNFFPLVQKMDLRAAAVKKGFKADQELVKQQCSTDLI